MSEIHRWCGRGFVLGFVSLLCVWAVRPGFAETTPYEKGLTALHTGHYHKAIRAFDFTLETIPHDYEAMSNRAVAWFHLKDYDRAISDGTRALEINPYYAVGANQLAWMLATCPDQRYRDGKRAVALAEQVVRRFPEANFMDTLAAAYAEAGNMEAAVRVQKMAVRRLKIDIVPRNQSSFEKRLNVYGQAVTDNRAIGIPRVKEKTAGGERKPKPPNQIAAARQAASHLSEKNRKPTAKATKGDTKPYSVHVLSCRKEQWAAEKASGLARENDPAFVCRTLVNADPEPWYRVCVGVFDTRAAARKHAAHLKRQGHEWANVVRLPKDAAPVKH